MLVVLCYAAVCCAVMLCCAVVGLSLGFDWGGDGCGVSLFWCVGGACCFGVLVVFWVLVFGVLYCLVLC